MGRITIFGREACPHCIRAERALIERRIPFSYIDVGQDPQRRQDMISLSKGACTVPQIFFNERHVGGADDLVHFLQTVEADRDHNVNSSSKAKATKTEWADNVLSAPDPEDHRLASSPELHSHGEESFSKLPLKSVTLPDGTPVTPVELLRRLQQVLQPRHRTYNFHWYKNCFVNTDAVIAVQDEFRVDADSATKFLRRLQKDYSLLHHVCDDRPFTTDGNLFFRLSCHRNPDILNSSIEWKRLVVKTRRGASLGRSRDGDGKAGETSSPIDTIYELQRRLNQIVARYTDQDGMADYVQVGQDPDTLNFEVASCILQDIDLTIMDEATRKAFCLNVYNLFITYAFVKVGVATDFLRRHAFYQQIKINVGGELLSFDDLENGILRGNAPHPCSSRQPFDEDRQRRLSLPTVDPRIHFALNCGAKSCPPIRFFRPQTVEEELDIVSQSFCEGDDAVLIKLEEKELHLSMIFKWFRTDFAPTRDELPQAVLSFLKKSSKSRRLMSLLGYEEDGTRTSDSCITVRFLSYDWSAKASHHKAFLIRDLKTNERNPTALIHFPQQCRLAATKSLNQVQPAM